ncbi:MAG: ribosome hibernation-promoting factor, HPF/YfiA family [Candidatus Binatia bacterium]
MKVMVTFRHVRSTDALRQYAEEKIARLERYLHRPMEAHVILEVLKKTQRAEINLIANGTALFGEQETSDLYSAIDLALDKVERQVKKLASRKKARGAHAGHSGTASVRHQVLAPEREAGTPPRVMRTRRVPAKPMSIDDAILEIERGRDEFIVFRNSTTEGLSVLYRRRDGNYGLIEPDPS